MVHTEAILAWVQGLEGVPAVAQMGKILENLKHLGISVCRLHGNNAVILVSHDCTT